MSSRDDWDDDDQTVDLVPEPPARSAKSGLSVGAAALYAAMHGLADVVQPEKTGVVFEQFSDRPVDPDGLDLEFGQLPPIEDDSAGYR